MKPQYYVCFVILKTSIQSFINEPIGKFKLIYFPNRSKNPFDLLQYDVRFETISKKEGFIRRIHVRNFTLYKLYFEGKPIHTFTNDEYDIIRPYLDKTESILSDYLDRLNALAENYNKWKNSESIRKPFLYHIKTGMEHFQSLFHNGIIESLRGIKGVYAVVLRNPELFKFPEMIICYEKSSKTNNKNDLYKFTYNLN